MKISIIGYGNMAKALAKRFVQIPAHQLHVSSPQLTVGIDHQGIHTHSSNGAIIPEANVILLAVKPAQMDTVLSEVKSLLSPHQLIISVAAGLNLAWFSQRLPPSMPLIRAMPNLAAQFGQSATPLFANQYVTDAQHAMVEALFLNCGIVTWATKEQDINAFTALSGSGPAYVFLFMNALTQAGIALGLAENIAKDFALQTVQGAVSLATHANLSFAELQKAVTSKGGTTAAAIEVFTECHFEQIIANAMQAACNRAQSLEG